MVLAMGNGSLPCWMWLRSKCDMHCISNRKHVHRQCRCHCKCRCQMMSPLCCRIRGSVGVGVGVGVLTNTECGRNSLSEYMITLCQMITQRHLTNNCEYVLTTPKTKLQVRATHRLSQHRVDGLERKQMPQLASREKGWNAPR
jgi:hypothetical protein